MSAFYVGQRVRKVTGECAGMTATVAELDPADRFGQTLGVRFDGPSLGWVCGGSVPVAAGELVWGYPHHFEPILPPGLESDAEIAALYQPVDGPVFA